MHLLAGLGNPGREYVGTRHNIGFLFLDHLAARHGLRFRESAAWQAAWLKARLWSQPLVLVKPQTFMNRSGAAVGAVARYFRVERRRVVVVHDDLDLPFGRLRVTFNRGAGGHNGVRSLIEHLGGKDFARIRVGVGRPGPQWTAADYVLARFSDAEQLRLEEVLTTVEQAVRLVLTEGVGAAMNQVNRSDR